MSFSIDVRRDDKDRILAELQRKQLSFVTKGGQVIRAESSVRAPVDTGNLRRSIISEPFNLDGEIYSDTGPTAEYAQKVEFGSSRQRAQPYMEPGFQAAKPKIDILERELKL